MALNLEVLYQETSQLLEQQAQIRQALKQMGAEEKIKVYAAVRRSLTQAAPWLIEPQVAKHVSRLSRHYEGE